ncbi:MAG TPA: P1 family peptidase [Gemmatimonadales bacterium]|jgi:D-aminopeptidase|nr:P1 family peptidase [Gemmatimonadales bacterium]
MGTLFRAVVAATSLSLLVAGAASAVQQRQTARQMGLVVGVLSPGPLNAITDVAGVLVGQVTVRSGDSVNTGVTVVRPHEGNLFRDKVPGAVVVGNGFGKLMGLTQVQELGEIESPIVLTCTLCVARAADATLTYLLGQLGNENVRSINVVVGETNDGTLNHIRARAISEQDVIRAIEEARPGPVEQGSVGAGRGTMAFGWKGGIGTSSRTLPDRLGGWTVGVLVQSNFGGILQIAGAPVGVELGRYYLRDEVAPSGRDTPDGSIMIVVATDAPLEHRNLTRLGRRALAGLARTGSSMSNGSGDYVIAFSSVPINRLSAMARIPNDALSPLFQAVIEATEEAIYNSLFMATTVQGYRGTATALPLDSTMAILRRYGVVRK